MTKAIGIRLPKDVIRKVEDLSRKESEDRSTIIRKLLVSGYRDFVARRAAQSYVKGEIIPSEAASQAEVNVWEMEEYLIKIGYESEYSVEDLESELQLLDSKK